MKRLRILFLLAILLYACKEKTETTRAKLGTLVESVYASVEVEPYDYYQVYAKSNGVIEELLVDEGDSVEKNDIIAVLSLNQSKLQVEDAGLQLTLAKENYQGEQAILANIQQELALNQEQERLDSLNYERQLNLWNQSIGSKTEVEALQLKYQSSRTISTLLKQQYEQKEKELGTLYKQSLNALAKAEDKLSDMFIRSNMDGIVYTINKNVGELLSMQEPVASIGKADCFIVKLSVDEVDIRKIELGQKTIVRLDAYPEEVFELSINKISPTKDAKTQTFVVEADFEDAPEKLFVGLSGEANIVIREENQVIWVPKEYLFDQNKLQTNNGEIEVELGLQNMNQVQIVSGIDTQTVLIKP